jgi:hypothetical protein
VVSGLGLAPMIAATSLLALAAGEKLPPPTRAAVLMALIGIALLGMLLVVIILLGGHWTRRQGSFRRGSAVPPDRRPIVGGPRNEHAAKDLDADGDADDLSTGETIINRTTRHDESEPA